MQITYQDKPVSDSVHVGKLEKNRTRLFDRAGEAEVIDHFGGTPRLDRSLRIQTQRRRRKE
jgi:hypothetical protein